MSLLSLYGRFSLALAFAPAPLNPPLRFRNWPFLFITRCAVVKVQAPLGVRLQAFTRTLKTIQDIFSRIMDSVSFATRCASAQPALRPLRSLPNLSILQLAALGSSSR